MFYVCILSFHCSNLEILRELDFQQLVSKRLRVKTQKLKNGPSKHKHVEQDRMMHGSGYSMHGLGCHYCQHDVAVAVVA